MTEDGIDRIDFLRKEERALRERFPGKVVESIEGRDLLSRWITVKRQIAMLETGEVPPSLLNSRLLPAFVSDTSAHRLYRGGWRTMVGSDSKEGENK